MMQLHQSRKQRRRAKNAEHTQLFADTKEEKRLLRDKESIGDPAADTQGSQKIKQAWVLSHILRHTDKCKSCPEATNAGLPCAHTCSQRQSQAGQAEPEACASVRPWVHLLSTLDFAGVTLSHGAGMSWQQ